MQRFSFQALLVFLFLFYAQFANAQSTSNRGKDFWVPYTSHRDALVSRMTLFLSSEVNTTYKVTVGSQVISSGTIQANIVTAVFINPNIYNVYISNPNVVETDKGIHVTTGDPIAVYSVISNSARTGSTLVLPTTTLGRDYYIFSKQSYQLSQFSLSQFCLVGVEDNTIIEITPSQDQYGGSRMANVPFQITLNKGQTYEYQSYFDLTGSRVRTVSGCNNFAVFGGTMWTAFCDEGNMITPNGGDNLYQQLFPTTAWGKNFLTAPFYNTLNGSTDLIRIIVAEDNTTITVNGSTTSGNGITLSNPYQKGSVISFFSSSPNYIQASMPIAVAQYQISQTCNRKNPPTSQQLAYPGDPEMTILNPVEQTLKDITVYSELNKVPGVNTRINTYYLNIIAKTAETSSFTLDGANITSQFTPIPNTIYSYAVINVTNSGTPQHRLKSASGFSAIAYGYGDVESYAYLAGTDLKNLSTNIQFFSVGNGTIPQSSFCLGADFDVVLQLPYITDKITWNLKDGAKVEVENNPSYTTTVKDGDTYYLYRHKVLASDLNFTGNFNFRASVVKPSGTECASTEEQVFSSFDIFQPDFSFGASNGKACVSTPISFSNTSASAGGTLTDFKWDFGDGGVSNVENPLHTYATAGTKTVTFTATSELGCTQSVSKTIEIIKAPVSKYIITSSACINSPVVFSNQSSPTVGAIVSTKWDFGDQTTSTEVSPSHTYTTAKTYTVNLISISAAGCADTLKSELYINPLPVVSFKDPGSCVDDHVLFEGVANQNIASWYWDFGDGLNDANENTKQNPRHKFAQPGIYTVTVTATSVTGCSNTYASTVSINGINPNAVFDVLDQSALCANREVQFKNNSTVGFGKVTKIEWIYDYQPGGANVKEVDLTPNVGKIYTHQYPVLAKDQRYKVVMIAYSGQECFTQSEPVEITVHAKPEITFENMGTICEDTPAFALTATVQTGLSGTATYTGKGVTPDGFFDPKLAGVGTWAINYKFTSEYSCAEEKTVTITVAQMPLLTMPENKDILRLGQVQLTAGAKGKDLKFKWTPSDGLSSDSIPNPIANPQKTTKYTLTLRSLTCTAVGEVTVSVHENPNIPNVFSPNGDGKNDTWSIKYLESFVNASIMIFNRFGQKVFSSAQYNAPWDGRYNGQDVPVGVYYYIIEPNNGRERFTGSVTVLR